MPSVRSIRQRLAAAASAASSPEQRAEQLLGALLARQRVDPELGVVGLAAPGVAVLRAVVDQQQDAGGRQALDQAVEQRLGLGVDPVQILEDQQQRLLLALAQQQPLAARRASRWRRCGGSSACPGGIVGPARRAARAGPAGRLAAPVERQQLAGQLLADGRGRRRAARSGSSS